MRTGEDWPKKIKAGNAVVTIYREKHPTYASGFRYKVWWTDAGKPQHESRSTESEAVELARVKAGQINSGDLEVASASRHDLEELRAIREICGTTPLLSAIREWRATYDRTGGHVVAAGEAWASRNSSAHKSVTVATAVEEFMRAKEQAGVDVSCSYQKILPTLKEKFSDRPIDTLRARELQAWMIERYPHPVTRNTARKRFVALWRWCRKQGYLPRDVQTEAEQTDTAREADQQIGVITAETFRKLLQLFRDRHPEYLAPLVVAGFCGLRRAEVHKQTWADILLDRKVLRVTNAKRNTPARRIVPLCDAAVKWLKRCKPRKGAICANLAVDRIREIARVAGFNLPDNCFRHSYISHRVAQTGNVAETSLEAGNSPKIIFSNYREVFSKEEGEAWFAS